MSISILAGDTTPHACHAHEPLPRAGLALLLLLHVAVWTWAASMSTGNMDTPGDMLEAYAWGQAWQWGYFKHPPLMAWIAGAWFSAMPRTTESFALLSATNTAIGLLGFSLLCREFMARRWVLTIVAAAMLAPGVTTMALRFNANAVLVTTWPWAALFFVRFMKRGALPDAVLCGAVAALAMLGKYFSVVLIASLLAAALVHQPWRARLATSSALLGAATFTLVLLPHVTWLLEHDLGPIAYAQQATGRATGDALVRALHFVGCQLVFPLLGFALIGAALPRHARPLVWRAWRSLLRPSRDPLWVLAMAPPLLTAIGTLATAARTSTVWGLPMSMGLLLYVGAALARDGARPDYRRVRRSLVCIWLAVALIAPVLWFTRARSGDPGITEPRAELAAAVESQWERAYGSRLAWVGGNGAAAAAVAFYGTSRSTYWSVVQTSARTPWLDDDALRQQGGAVVCDWTDAACRAAGAALGFEQTLDVHREQRGWVFPSRRFAVYWIAPTMPPGWLDAPI